MDILARVTKRLIDVDDEKVARAKAVLGTATLKATIDRALDELIALDARRRALLEMDQMPTGLADDTRRRAAWR